MGENNSNSGQAFEQDGVRSSATTETRQASRPDDQAIEESEAGEGGEDILEDEDSDLDEEEESDEASSDDRAQGVDDERVGGGEGISDPGYGVSGE